MFATEKIKNIFQFNQFNSNLPMFFCIRINTATHGKAYLRQLDY